jgi:hypothetical protein
MALWWQEAREKVAGTHVHLLENQAVVLDNGTRFLGCTLWTDFTLFGHDRQEELGVLAEKNSNDFRNIFLTRRGPIRFEANPYVLGVASRRTGDRITWKHMAELHRRSREFLEAELGKAGNWDQTIVVTHHAPSKNGIENPELPVDLDAAYASSLDHLVKKADCWIHGHVHRALEYPGVLGGRVIENARGYSDSGPHAVPNFRWDKVIDTKRAESG